MKSVDLSAPASLEGAIAHLAAFESDLAARLEATRKALGVLRGESSLAAPAARPARATAKRGKAPRAKKGAKSFREISVRTVSPDAVRAVLKRGGAMSVGAVAAALPKASVNQARYALSLMLKAGEVVATGATSSRRYALPGKPAKEAP
jgi:hypothetical protein